MLRWISEKRKSGTVAAIGMTSLISSNQDTKAALGHKPEKLIVFTGADDGSAQLVADLPALAGVDCECFAVDQWLRLSRGSSDVAVLPVLVVSAVDGVMAQDLACLRLLSFLNYQQVCFIVDKLDQTGFDFDHFSLMSDELTEAARANSLNVTSILASPLPLQLKGEWAQFANLAPLVVDPVRLEQGARLVVSNTFAQPARDRVGDWSVIGHLASGALRDGDQLIASPSNKRIVIDSVRSVETDGQIQLSFREPFFPEVGEVLSHESNAPVLSAVLCLRTLWRGPMPAIGDSITIQFWFGDVSMKVDGFIRIATSEEISSRVVMRSLEDDFCEIVVRADRLLPIDAIDHNCVCGVVSLVGETGTPYDGFVVTKGYADQRRFLSPKSENLTSVSHYIEVDERQKRNGHKGGVLWFTGLSGAGKSTLAVALEKRLFDLGYQVFVLDGDNVRQGLTANLGFSPDDRAENIRRVGEVAALFREAGTIVISSFISPYRSDRDRARHAAFPDFHEIFIEADVATCIARDPKGLYRKAIKGDIRDFTGISAPYEPPIAPELTINTERFGVDQCLEQLVNYVERHFRL